MIQQSVDGVSFALKEEHNFRWLKKHGRVFKVWDEQDSGNLCFGVERNGVRRFIKYAGAKPLKFIGNPEDAVARLEKAKLRYEFMKHANLVRLVHHEKVGDGYMLEFDWIEGVSLRKYSFETLPLHERLHMLTNIFTFHEHVEKKQFVAVDFYDASMIYDESSQTLKVCDIDLYEKIPYTNEMDRLWGSSRFMAPEEFQIGEELDARTNVYRMGATAFVLLGKDQSLAESPIHKVAKRAMSKRKEDRFQTVKAFHDIWKQAVDVSMEVRGY
ncbi:protein kinase [Geomicrobium sp. JCM 19039]|uniref:protein kinase domain-containing protein n=1 Tax=Geomicrobium sp. JCM 19039 TaxID=1460636 RepID=UPI00045F1BB4|nr:protein kinase [Geomicrobium sp. JCM 19039]GAK12418.1 serine/threonine protein kinase [Geomicrobium sp. JCM 19039]